MGGLAGEVAGALCADAARTVLTRTITAARFRSVIAFPMSCILSGDRSDVADERVISRRDLLTGLKAAARRVFRWGSVASSSRPRRSDPALRWPDDPPRTDRSLPPDRTGPRRAAPREAPCAAGAV